MSKKFKKCGRLFGGILLVSIGVLFLLENLYIIDFSEILSNFWPLILVAVGIKIIIKASNEKKKQEQAQEPVTA